MRLARHATSCVHATGAALARAVLATRAGEQTTMAAPERADDTGEREGVETVGVRPDESGTRLCTQSARLASEEDVVEIDEEEELELVEVVIAPRRRAAAIPPPPPRRAQSERFDLDELLRDVVRAPALAAPTAPALDVEPPAAAPVKAAPSSGSRSRVGIAVVMGTTGIIVGAITAAVLVTTRSSEPADGDSAEMGQPDIVLPEIVEAPAPAPDLSLAIAPEEPEPAPERMQLEPESVQAAPAHGRRPRRAAAAAERDEAEGAPSLEAATRDSAAAAAATQEAASQAAEPAAEAGEATEASAASLPERPTRDDVDAAVDGVMPALRACGEGLDLITLELHFVSSGRATTATADARHLTPEQRSCVARAARGARVPPFSAAHLSVRYPVRL